MNHENLLAGAARGNITPRKDMLPLPLIAVISFRKVIDPIYVRVLALCNGSSKSLFITMDTMLLPFPEETMSFLSSKLGVARENIFLSVTHTHSTPALSFGDKRLHSRNQKCRQYYEWIKTITLDTAKEALANMVPCKYGYGEGTSYINVNRDVIVGKKAILGSNFERPSDKSLRLLRFEDRDGKVIAMIVNYACHAVVLNGYLSGLSTGISGDFPGKTCERLENQMDGAVVLWCSGAAGDQNPKLMTQCSGYDENGKPVKKFLKELTYTVLELISDEHVRDILKVNQSITCMETDGSIYCAEQVVPIENKNGSGEIIPYILRLWMIGKVAFLGISAEVATTVGKVIRESAPFEKAILVSHTCGYHGYIADDWEFEHNAFEVGNCFAPKGVAQDAFLEGFRKLYSKKQQEVSNGDITL